MEREKEKEYGEQYQRLMQRAKELLVLVTHDWKSTTLYIQVFPPMFDSNN